ncbi:ankyrin repeat-containing protein, putative [Ricinus communis]|uniref:Ankyrin repeat-containing protein, putative n=1 Tax=Ricinus communis TaxID=3988 RepID=B9S6L9_RICCO|nr:ankyrin repeat-containing protein, putative [Ricinus communis]
MDLEIRVAADYEGSCWEQRSKRLQLLMEAEGLQQQQPDISHDHDDIFIDLQALQEAMRKADADCFLDTLARISAEKRSSLSTIFGQVGPSGNSLLHVAISSGNEEIAQLIAFHFPLLIFKKDVKGDTALHFAAKSGLLDTVRILVCCGKDFSGTDVVSLGAESTSSTEGDRLLRAKNVHGYTALHEVVMNKRYDVVQFLISADPEVWYYENKEGWSPLYMAVKIYDMQIFQLLLQAPIGHGHSVKRLEGNPPAHIAFMEGKTEEMGKMNPEILHLEDGKGRTVLHWAAYAGHNIDTVCFLLSQCRHSMFKMDNKGSLPIHIASKRGHIVVIKEFLKHWPYPTELLNKKGQNFLDTAAKSGKVNVVRYILETPVLENLLNEKDVNGNTPLHLAAMNSHPAVVLTLTWDKRINLNLLNNDMLSALDVSPWISSGAPRSQYNITLCALWSAGVCPSLDLMIHKQKGQNFKRQNPRKFDYLKERVGILILLETLVVTVTFAAAFTMPGGYNSSDSPDKGMATMLSKPMFQLFVICNTAAFYCSIVIIPLLGNYAILPVEKTQESDSTEEKEA